MEQKGILEWILISECQIPSDVNKLLVKGEEAIAAYKTFRDIAIFTNKRLIVRDSQGITGKKKDFTSIPYSKITTFSLETAGTFDLDAELEIYLAGVGKVKFEFTGSTDVKQICKMISQFALA